jgi:hypothetical protein
MNLVGAFLPRWVGKLAAPLLGALCFASVPVSAQTFSSGSNGSYGAMNITKDTVLQMPPDGVFHCTTITVAPGARLYFVPNALNTPVYLLAKGEITISGGIDVSGESTIPGMGSGGRGGPGGFPGGSPPRTSEDISLSEGSGPGGGVFWDKWLAPLGGTYASGIEGWGVTPQQTYGNRLLIPLIGGSGGCGGRVPIPGLGGGGGGGAILVASSTKVSVPSSGWIASYGGNVSAPSAISGAGSGGAVRIVSPVLQGTGMVIAKGGAASANPSFGQGGEGRIRLDVIDRSGWNLTFNPQPSWGANMVVFPSTQPRLDIVSAAGMPIPVGSATGAVISLPAAADAAQTVTVRAADFSGTVPITVHVVPEVGVSMKFTASLEMATNPAEVVIPITLVSGMTYRIYAWAQ